MKALISVTGLSLVLLMTGCSQETKQEVGDAASGALSDAKNAAGEAGEQVTTTVTAAKVAVTDAAGNLGEEMSGLVDQASEKLADIEGGSEMLGKVTGFFESAREAVSGISDTETAKAAMEKLNELGGSLEGLAEKMKDLPEGAKAALTSVIEKGIAGLQVLVDKAGSTVSGAEDIIQPKFEALKEKLSALTGRE